MKTEDTASNGGPKPTTAKLITGPVNKTLIKLTIPMFFGIMSMMLFNLVDTFFVGQLGTAELAAMSFTFPVVFIINSIALGLGVGGSSAVSRAIGEGDPQKVKRLTTDALMLALLIVISFVVMGLMTIDPLFRLLGATDKTLPLIKQYMTIWYPGVAFVIIPMVGNGAIRATGDTKTPSIIMMASGGVNLILDPLLIFGLGPFPRWGLQGAAVATVIARAAALVVSLWVLHWREKMIILKPPKFKEGLDSWKQILYVGIPAAGTYLIIPISMGIITRLVSSYGPEAVAGLGVAARLEAMVLTVFMALGSVMVPFVGQNIGAKQLDRVKQALSVGQKFTMIWGGIVFLLFIPLARPIAGLFDKNEMVIDTIVMYLLMVSITFGLQGIAMIAGSTFNGLNNPMPAAALSLFRMIILYIPLAYVGSHLFQLKGIFGAAAIANTIAGIAAYLWLKRSIGLEEKKSLL
jgi:MATE family, multidrug efflux pump